jgi:hypothetical protein
MATGGFWTTSLAQLDATRDFAPGEPESFSVEGNVDTSLNRKCESAGIRTNAPTIFQRNMKVSKIPISAWNLIGDHAQVTTAAANVTPMSAITFPVKFKADRCASSRE